MKYPCRIYGVVILALLSQACQNAVKAPAKRFDKNPGFVTDIPQEDTGRNANGAPGFYYHFLAEELGITGLDSLEYGYDSLQIRIWLGHSLAIKNHVVIISSTNGEWRAQLITVTTENERPLKMRQTNKSVRPKSGWTNFVKSLNGYNITDLPQSDYNKACQNCGADGIGYYFEISTTQSYRYFHYCNPETAHGCPQAATILQFAAYLEKEFDFTYTK